MRAGIRITLVAAGVVGAAFAAGWLTALRAEGAAMAPAPSAQAVERKKDVCEFEFGTPCSSIPHDVGPAIADEMVRSRACSNGVFVNRVNGRWVVAKDSRVDRTGEMIATACRGTTP